MGRRGGVLLVAVLLLAGCAGPAADADDRADARRIVLETLDSAWRGDSPFDRPAVVTPRFFLPSGWGYKIQECMNDAGHADFVYDPENGFRSGDLPARTEGVEALARYSCVEQYPSYDTRYSSLRDSDLDTLWDYYQRFLRPCLSLQGIELASAPDRGEFAGDGPGMAGSWNPWLTARVPADVPTTRAALAACAPYPQGWQAPGAE